MDKEKIVTIVIGLIVGGGLAGIYFFGGKFLPKLNQQAKSVINSPGEARVSQTVAPKALAITLDAPDDNSSTTISPISVSGSSSPNSVVFIFANADEKLATADASGKFSADIKLEEGENEITVTSLADTSRLITVKRNVTLEITQ